MASCEHISELLQAYADSEVTPSERSLTEQHLQECIRCAEELREIKSMSASLFESFAPRKLSPEFPNRVRRHVAMVVASEGELHAMNVRAKRGDWGEQPMLKRWAIPMAAAAVLVAVSFVIVDQLRQPEAIGIVTATTDSGVFLRRSEGGKRPDEPVTGPTLVYVGDRLYAKAGAKSVLEMYDGGTEMRLDEASDLQLHGTRSVSLWDGQMWADVAPSGVPFRVSTPAGEVEVLGTRLNISIAAQSTVVTVAEGSVTFRTSVGEALVEKGYESVAARDHVPQVSRKRDVERVMQWATNIDSSPRTATGRVLGTLNNAVSGLEPAEKAYMFNINGDWTYDLKRIRVNRDAFGTQKITENGSLKVEIKEAADKTLATVAIPYRIFDGTDGWYSIDVPGSPQVHKFFYIQPVYGGDSVARRLIASTDEPEFTFYRDLGQVQ
jgi:hypothetical protein